MWHKEKGNISSPKRSTRIISITDILRKGHEDNGSTVWSTCNKYQLPLAVSEAYRDHDLLLPVEDNMSSIITNSIKFAQQAVKEIDKRELQ